MAREVAAVEKLDDDQAIKKMEAALFKPIPVVEEAPAEATDAAEPPATTAAATA
jgi:hypothetical protein